MKSLRCYAFISFLVILVSSLLLLSCSGSDDDDDNDDNNDDDDNDDDASDDDDDDDDDDNNDDDNDDDNDVGGDVWTDSASGLVWQNASDCCFDREEAIAHCDDLTLDGNDDWRLPTISELRSLIRGCDATVSGGDCGVTDACNDFSCWSDVCEGCDDIGGPGTGGTYLPPGVSGELSWYWSSSDIPDLDYYGWIVDFTDGMVHDTLYNYDNYVRCVL